MKITIESTTRLVELDTRQMAANRSLSEGVVPARIWEGETDSGIKVICFITRVLVHKDETTENMRKFEAELAEQRAPSTIVQAIPLRLIL